LLKGGWRPKRTIVFGSWDAEEEGLMGSTEWVEDHMKEMANTAAYFNVDVSVSGPNFGASGVPSLKPFLIEVAQSVPAAKGGTVYDVWKTSNRRARSAAATNGTARATPTSEKEVAVGDLGSGSDYTPFFQHAGVPSSDIGSSGDYGVYHSVFDNFAWFKKFGDPDFTLTAQMARVLGIEVIHMADVDVLPFDYKGYGEAINKYLTDAKTKSTEAWGDKSPSYDAALAAAKRFTDAGEKMAAAQASLPADAAKINRALRDAERALLTNDGLPRRPWFKHTVFAPGEYTGYAAVVIPGVNEAIDANDAARMEKQLAVLTAALGRSAQVMEDYK
jgi:N-acetylated-alpha-linked acidic dipeptidase